MEWHLVQKDPHEMLKLIKVLYIQIFKIKYSGFWKGFIINTKSTNCSPICIPYVFEWTVWSSFLVVITSCSSCLRFHVLIRPSKKSFSTISSMFCRARLQKTFWLSSLWPSLRLGKEESLGFWAWAELERLLALLLNTWLSRLKKGSSCSMLRMMYRVSIRCPGSQVRVLVEQSSSGFFWGGGGDKRTVK